MSIDREVRAEIVAIKKALVAQLGIDFERVVHEVDRVPVTWQEMVAAGLDPETGEPL
jgi:hypothetical protein